MLKQNQYEYYDREEDYESPSEVSNETNTRVEAFAKRFLL